MRSMWMTGMPVRLPSAWASVLLPDPGWPMIMMRFTGRPPASVAMRSGGAARGDQIIEARVLAEVQPAGRREGDALDVDHFHAGAREEAAHLLGIDELVEIVRALGNAAEALGERDRQQ